MDLHDQSVFLTERILRIGTTTLFHGSPVNGLKEIVAKMPSAGNKLEKRAGKAIFAWMEEESAFAWAFFAVAISEWRVFFEDEDIASFVMSYMSPEEGGRKVGFRDTKETRKFVKHLVRKFGNDRLSAYAIEVDASEVSYGHVDYLEEYTVFKQKVRVSSESTKLLKAIARDSILWVDGQPGGKSVSLFRSIINHGDEQDARIGQAIKKYGRRQ